MNRNLKLRFRRSFLGYLWTLLVPLSTAAIYYFLFKVIFRVHLPDFAAFITTGILVWTFYSGTIKEGMGSVISGFSILLQVNVPLNIFPLTTALTNLLTFIFSTPVIAAICIVSGITLKLSAIMLFPYIFLLLIQSYCISYILSVAVIYVRDLQQVLGPVLQIWMYGTPILYQMNQIPERHKWLLFANPIGKIFSGIHNSVLRHSWPTMVEIVAPVAWTVVIVLISFYFHTKISKVAVERI